MNSVARHHRWLKLRNSWNGKSNYSKRWMTSKWLSVFSNRIRTIVWIPSTSSTNNWNVNCVPSIQRTMSIRWSTSTFNQRMPSLINSIRCKSKISSKWTEITKRNRSKTWAIRCFCGMTSSTMHQELSGSFRCRHGSRLTNFAGIMSQGLRIAPPEAPVVSQTTIPFPSDLLSIFSRRVTCLAKAFTLLMWAAKAPTIATRHPIKTPD